MQKTFTERNHQQYISNSQGLSWADFELTWANLVSDECELSKFNQHWEEIKARIPFAATEYIWFIWILPFKEKFCAPYLMHVTHFGNLTTSRIEGKHAALKSCMRNSNLNLLGAYETIRRHVQTQHHQ